MNQPYCRIDGGQILFGNDHVELAFDAGTGRWTSLTDREDGVPILRHGELLSPIHLTVNGRTQSSRGYQQMFSLVDAETIGLRWQLDGYENVAEEAASRLVIRLREGDWRCDLVYRLRLDSARLERRVRIQYEGDDEALLRHFLLRQPYAHLGPAPDCFLEAPGHPVRPHRPVSSLPYAPWGQLPLGTFTDVPAWRPPLIGIDRPDSNRAISFWAWTETEPFYPLVEKTDHGVILAHRVHLADRFTRGHSIEWGTQYFQLHHDPWMGALRQFQDFYREVGMISPADVPDWAKSVEIFEVHVGTLTGTGLAPFPTYEPLLETLPSIKEKGYDVVYLMPHVPYPSYSVIDYMNMDVQQGSDSGFRAFVARSHELGLRVFIDVTMHGVMDRRGRRLLSELDGHGGGSYPMEPSMPEVHPYLTEHPEWFSRAENGDIAMTYTYAFDHASPSWQDFMCRVFRHYVEEYDVDGFRVDSHTWNFFPNWGRGLSNRASDSFYGSARLFEKVRRELKTIKPDVVLYSETAGPLFCATHDLIYNYDETWLLLSAIPIVSRKGLLCHFAHPMHVTTERMTAWHIAHWLAQRQLVTPPGAIRVHHLDCHDTYWVSREFRRRTFGIPASRAIVAFFAFIEGGFMDYYGAEEGSEEFYRQVVTLRRTQPVLKRGSCDYLAVKPTNQMVFAPLREWEGRVLLPVINIDNAPSETGFDFPLDRLASLPAKYDVWDLINDQRISPPTGESWDVSRIGELRLELPPYGVRLLDFRPVTR